MTLFLPLEGTAPLPQSPSFIVKSPDPQAQVSKLIKTILKARRIVVICGAGISVQAGIPDFRSPEGLFQTLRRDNPKDALSSGKDLFDASVFNSEHMTSLFCQMISRLSNLSESAEPTSFHKFLRALDDSGRLLRVYTQNIDAIESKCGLSFGLPDTEGKRTKTRARPSADELNEVGDPGPSTSASRHSTPLPTPRCIPLHGTLQNAHCQICTHSFPLTDYLSSFAAGVPPQCPECTSMERTRQLIGKRARGVGKLRPSVVLYNEMHKDGEGVGEIVRRDLVGSKGRSGADLLLVVGTSLRVPGTKRMVREFAKAVNARGSSSKEGTPTKEKEKDEEQAPQQPLKALYLNLDFPVPTREWEGVFDAWVQGDAQTFARMMQEEMSREARAKELAIEKRKKREQELAMAALLGEPLPKARSKAGSKDGTPKKRKSIPKTHDSDAGAKRRKMVAGLPTPPHSTNKTQMNDRSPHHSSSHRPTSNPPSPPPSPSCLILRIPPRPRVDPLASHNKKKILVPEVVLSPMSPLTPMQNSRSSIGAHPPTPEGSPPPRASGSLSQKRFLPVESSNFSVPNSYPHTQPSSRILGQRSLPPSHSRSLSPGSGSVSSLSSCESESDESDESLTKHFKQGWAQSSGMGYRYGRYNLPTTGNGCLRDEGLNMAMDADELRSRLGTSCIRTTQFEVGA